MPSQSQTRLGQTMPSAWQNALHTMKMSVTIEVFCRRCHRCARLLKCIFYVWCWIYKLNSTHWLRRTHTHAQTDTENTSLYTEWYITLRCRLPSTLSVLQLFRRSKSQRMRYGHVAHCSLIVVCVCVCVFLFIHLRKTHLFGVPFMCHEQTPWLFAILQHRAPGLTHTHTVITYYG